MLKLILQELEKQSESFKFDEELYDINCNTYYDECNNFHAEDLISYIMIQGIIYEKKDYTTTELVTKIIEDFGL